MWALTLNSEKEKQLRVQHRTCTQLYWITEWKAHKPTDYESYIYCHSHTDTHKHTQPTRRLGKVKLHTFAHCQGGKHKHTEFNLRANSSASC